MMPGVCTTRNTIRNAVTAGVSVGHLLQQCQHTSTTEVFGFCWPPVLCVTPTAPCPASPLSFQTNEFLHHFSWGLPENAAGEAKELAQS